jgi:dephospho-CoA kinase
MQDDFRPRVFVVVLTGGIASGKTMVSDRFKLLGVPVVDTDLIAHEMVEPGQPALAKIADTLGSRFLDRDGRLHRGKMRQAIFSDPDLKKQLESILHPAIADQSRMQIAAMDAPYCLLVVPLMAESELFPWVDRVLVVDIDEDLQLERLMERDDINRNQATRALHAQASRQQRLDLADDVLDNSGSLEEIDSEIEKLHTKYIDLSALQHDSEENTR